MSILKNIFIEKILFSLLIFTIFLNYEFNIIEIVSEGEKLRNSFNLILDKEINLISIDYTTLSIPLNLFDIIFILSFVYIFFQKRREFLLYISNILNNTPQKKILIIFLILFIYILTVLIFKKANFSNSQFVVQFLHFLKLFQCFLTFFIISYFIKNSNLEKIIKILIIFSCLLSVSGIFHILEIFDIYNTIDNRMTFGGLLILNFSILPILSLSKSSSIYTSKFWKIVISLSVFTSVFYCLACGKRAIYIISLSIIIISIVSILIYRKNFINQAYFLIFILAFPVLVFTYFANIPVFENQQSVFSNLVSKKQTKTFLNKPIGSGNELGPKYRVISMNLCRLEIKKTFKLIKEIDNFNKLTNRVLDRSIDYNNKVYQKLKNDCFLLKLDHSTVIRLSKHVKSLMLLHDNFLGIGFWGTQYEFNFLPDSGLQFFLEIGIIGIIIFYLCFYNLYSFLKKEKITKSILTFLPINLVLASFIGLSFFSSILYEWRYMLIMSIFTYLIVKKRKIN